MTQADFPLPPDLPAPADDGAAAHLIGIVLPSLRLPSTDGELVTLPALPGPCTVLYLYPMTGRPGVPLPDGWDVIPGARGCTPESCGFRDHHEELARLGAHVYGLASQDSAYQKEAVARLGLPFPLLSDPALRLGEALGLPTFSVEGTPLYKRLTIVASQGRVEHVFYPVFPPDAHAEEVLRWLASVPPAGPGAS